MKRRGFVRLYDGVEIMSASSCYAYDCGSPECDHVHLIGYDSDDIPYCEIVINEDEINKLHDLIAERDRKRGH